MHRTTILHASASCTVVARFAPTATGARGATLTLTDTAPHTVALSEPARRRRPRHTDPGPARSAAAAGTPRRRRSPRPRRAAAVDAHPEARVVPARAVELRVRCDRACTGTATVRRNGAVAGRARFTARPGGS